MNRIVAALLLIFCLPAGARETVTWFVDQSYPPAHIASGPYAGQGLLDRELSWLIAHLPQFDHIILDSTAARTWREIGREDAACNPGALKTSERERRAVFSAPATRSWGVMLIVRNDHLPTLKDAQTQSGSIDLARLFKQESLHGVITNGRSYSPLIDTQLATPNGHRAVQVLANSFQGLRMVTAGRTDYAIGFSHELAYLRKIDGSSEPLTLLPIEGMARYTTGYVACSDQPVGRAVIAAVNDALAHEASPRSYVLEGKQWFGDKEFEELMSPALWTSP